MSQKIEEFICDSKEQTKSVARDIAKTLRENDIVVLNGELGAGKTVFMSGIASYFSIEDEISSPTFTIVNEHTLKTGRKLFHFDVYRLEDSDEFLNKIGTEYFDEGICVIEWGNIIKDILPKRTIYIDILKEVSSPNTRKIIIKRSEN